MSEVLSIEELHSMLGEEIENGNGKLPVHHAYNYGDHHRTIVAPEVTEASVTDVEYSDYHNSHKLTEDESEDSHQAFVIE